MVRCAGLSPRPARTDLARNWQTRKPRAFKSFSPSFDLTSVCGAQFPKSRNFAEYRRDFCLGQFRRGLPDACRRFFEWVIAAKTSPKTGRYFWGQPRIS
jgi:hypothetical protein